jgi:hypothetical protein
MNVKKDLRKLFQEQLPAASLEELKKKATAHQRNFEQLQTEIKELKTELDAKIGYAVAPPWPGALEPLLLAAAFVLGSGDVESITVKALELSSTPYRLMDIRFTVHRLVGRGLLSEHDRCFTITPQGERELAHARDDAKRWTDALGGWPGPSAGGS